MAMEVSYRNKNRGYQQLRVWQDAIDFYVACCRGFKAFPYDLRRVTSQGIASADSVHHNIAEGYCRRSVREYMQFLNYALGSLGESVSGLIAYHKAGQLRQIDFDTLNALAFKLENGLLKLVASLERKETAGDWIDLSCSKKVTAPPGANRFSHYSTTPSLQFSWTQSKLKS